MKIGDLVKVRKIIDYRGDISHIKELTGRIIEINKSRAYGISVEFKEQRPFFKMDYISPNYYGDNVSAGFREEELYLADETADDFNFYNLTKKYGQQ